MVETAVPTTKKQHIHLLLPPELDRQVRELAQRERRSLVVQIEMLIERALQEQAA